MIVMIFILMLAFSPVIFAMFGRPAWNRFSRMAWEAMAHPSGPVVAFPSRWKRLAMRLVRPPRKESVEPQKNVS
ncbi:MAG: hypothetical protein C7B44_10490 [Sulfobacillus thermosulfidooxidans]|uniref:hypothetical protein n=1 Tax=Sulfobacillus TaxID=28033 RepID=UPI000CD278C3|nr:hypothetical protein [Sulfobacillus sp. hq2]POB09869.1 hypothetical protein CO251_13300 [Sulfobacillus sp. hq2]PSR36152.1 MAG: hypothetical protein C7B44_10490 [Sulfobacillus thermosulfidooxidans]